MGVGIEVVLQTPIEMTIWKHTLVLYIQSVFCPPPLKPL